MTSFDRSFTRWERTKRRRRTLRWFSPLPRLIVAVPRGL